MTDSERNDLLERVLRSYATDEQAQKYVDLVAHDPNTTPITYIAALAIVVQHGQWLWLQRS